jgi:polysaccharide export outer membrane protein
MNLLVRNRIWLSLVLVALVAMFAAATVMPPAMAQEAGLPGPSVLRPATSAVTAPVMPVPSSTGGTVIDDNYRLGTGDKVKITVYGEEDLSGEFSVDGSGQVQLPLVGQVRAAGLSLREFAAEVREALGSKYLRDPKVSAQIVNYRPFYIIGEVNKPGEFPYENGLSVLGAVALAGGFTYRADESAVYIRRNGSSQEQEFPTSASTRVYPGDIIRIGERLF